MHWLSRAFHYLLFVAKRFINDRCLMVAGSLTYTSMLAIVPIFTIALTLAARWPATQPYILRVKTFIIKNLLPEVTGRSVTFYIEQFAHNAERLTFIGLVIIFATALMLMLTIDDAFNSIWRTRRKRTWWLRLSAYTAVIAIGPLLLGISLSLTSYLAHLTSQLDHVFRFADDVILTVVPFLLTSAALILAYRVIPKRHVPVKHAWAGGFLAAMLFEATKHLFVAYVARVPTYSLVYGAFASLPIFLVWLYCCWVVVLIGAEVAATFSYFHHPEAQDWDSDHVRSLALKIVSALHVTGENKRMDFAALRREVPMPIDLAEDLLDRLMDAGIVGQLWRDGRNQYQLISNVNSLTDVEAALASGR